MDPSYETVRAAALRVGLHERTLWKWLSNGRLRRYEIAPDCWRLKTLEVDAAFASRRPAGRPKTQDRA